MRNFYGGTKRKQYFEGWYLKHQTYRDTIAFIPSFHITSDGQKYACLQIITDEEAFCQRFPIGSFHAHEKNFDIKLGNCHFSSDGCELTLKANDFFMSGSLKYSPFATVSYDIMGPFRYVPFLQCRHRVVSLSHRVDGNIQLNGKHYQFENGRGYIEGDRGISFPSRYLWTQCNFNDISVMVSVADIPLAGTHFTGCIGSIWLYGKEIRFATYLGVKIQFIDNHHIILTQKDYCLEIKLIDGTSKALQAPQYGHMGRVIHESAACQVQYCLKKASHIVFDFVSDRASFESEWQNVL